MDDLERWEIGGRTLGSRLLIGSARYPSPADMQEAVRASGAEVITLALRRENPKTKAGQAFWAQVRELGLHVLPNTAGCQSVDEVITVAEMARELFETDWLKLEFIGDDATLQPDPVGTVTAARELVKRGFVVFPYVTEDLVVCRHLVDAGCDILMPWGSPIGSGRGLEHADRLARLRDRFPDVKLLVDAGIGAPSHAAHAMELGFDGVLLNTAIARADDPVMMGQAFRAAIRAGRMAWLAGLMPQQDSAVPSTPTVGVPFWHQEPE